MVTTTDRLREKWERITPRERRMVVLLGVAFIVTMLAWVGFQISDGLTAIEKRNKSIRAALVSLQQYRLTGSQRKSNQVQVEIPDEPVKLETYLEGIAGEVGVSVPSYNARPPVTKNGFVETSTRIDLRAVSVFQLKDFLERVETRSQVVVITSLHIKRQFREKELLDADMVVTTYSKVKEAAPGTEGATGGEGG